MQMKLICRFFVTVSRFMLNFIYVPITVSVHIGSVLSAPSKYHAQGPVGSGSETHHEEHRRSSTEC